MKKGFVIFWLWNEAYDSVITGVTTIDVEFISRDYIPAEKKYDKILAAFKKKMKGEIDVEFTKITSITAL